MEAKRLQRVYREGDVMFAVGAKLPTAAAA